MASHVFELCFLRIHHIFREVVSEEELLLQGGYFAVFVEIMHFLAQTADGVSSVFFFVCVVNGREYFRHRSIFVDELFEADEFRYEVIHLGRAFCRSHQEEDVVQVAFFRNDAVFTQVVCENVARDTEFFIAAIFYVDAFGHELQLHRINEVLALAVAIEAMPFSTRFECPVIHVICHLFGIALFPLLAVDHRRYERTDVVAVAEHLFSGLDHGLYSVDPELLAAFAFMHLRIDIECREELVERRGGCMHHECVVHALMRYVAILPLDVGVFLVDLGGHGETSLLFVDGLADEDARIFRSEVEQQRAAVLHHRDELFVADPSGVEEDVIAEMTDLIYDLTGIVDAAVVGAELDDRETDRALCLCFHRIFFSDELSDIVFVEAVFRDAADGAERISCGFQIDRGRACQNQCAMVDGFMVVSIEENDIARCQDCIQNHLVRSGGTVQYEVGLVCIVYACCVFLCCQCRTFMDQKIAHRYVSVAEVSAEGILAEEFIECTACRMLAEESTALMAWAVELGVAIFDIFLEVTEEWRQHIFFIVSRSALDLASVEIMVGLIEIHDAVYFGKQCVFCQAFAGLDHQYRDLESGNHFLLKDVFVLIRNNDSSYICEISAGEVSLLAAGDSPEDFQSFISISDL